MSILRRIRDHLVGSGGGDRDTTRGGSGSEVVIQAFNIELMAGDLDALVRAVREVDPGMPVRTYETSMAGPQPETGEVIQFWITGTQALTPLLPQAVRWVRERRRQPTPFAFYTPDGTVLKYILVKDDGSEPEDVTGRNLGAPGPRPPRR